MNAETLLRRIFLILVILFCPTIASRAQSSVKINEVFANNKVVDVGNSLITDWVELYNTSSSPVSLAGASLSDNASNPRRWIFPSGVSISGNGYLLVLLDSGNPASVGAGVLLNAGFSLKSEGATLFFYPALASTTPLDSTTFGLQISTHSIGRIPDGTGNWVLTEPTASKANLAASLGSFSALRVNEWMPAPTKGEDWFEIFNGATTPVALNGLFLTDDLSTPNKYAIPPLSFIGIGEDAYIQFWADNQPSNGADHTNFKLNNTAETISIYGPGLLQIDSISYTDPAVDTSYGRLPDGGAKIAPLTPPGTPGEPNFSTLDSLVINEVLTHTDPPIEDAAEIYNTTSSPISVGGWYLSNKSTDLKRYRVPDGTVVPAKGYVVFYESQFNGPTALSPFTFNSAHGDQVYFSEADSAGNLTGYRISEVFEAAEHGISFGRYGLADVPGDYKFVAMNSLTFGPDGGHFGTGTGASNSYPKVGPIVISEIMYHPPSLDGTTNDNTLHEYIEIQNITGTNVPLYHPVDLTNYWRLQSAVDYSFPDHSSLAAYSFAIIVSFDPAIQTNMSNFRGRYPNLPLNTPVFGPWSGKLDNSGDPVELYKPDSVQEYPHPDAGFVPYIRVDKVNYLPGAPWPGAADGTGSSLQRKNSSLFGNDPINWEAVAPTPGSGSSVEIVDHDGDGMPDQWELANGLNPDDSSDAALDSDGDTFTNLQEYIAGTDPHDPASHLKIDAIVSFVGPNVPLTIRFSAAANKSYTVQFRSDLNSGTAWQKLSDVPTQSAARSAEVTDPDAYKKTDRYYRVVTPATN